MKYYFSIVFVCISSLITAQSLSPQTKKVDIKSIQAEITLDTLLATVSGNISVKFKPKVAVDSIYLDARSNYKIIPNTSQDKKYTTVYRDKKIIIKGEFNADAFYTVDFKYEVTPKKALYFWGWNAPKIDPEAPNRKQIWTQGQGKYTSHWLPSIDDMNDKIIFDLHINFDKNYKVLSNGIFQKEVTTASTKTWHYSTVKPISSYLVALVIGKYNQQISSTTNGTRIENYIYPDREKDYESTYKYHQKIFDFLEFEIGVPYPWHTYRQVPVRDFLYAGMENVGCTIFDDDFIVDENTFNEKNLVNISAHELAHQWFGNLVTEKNSKHHWLHEGFATFYALKTEQYIFGNDYYYFKLYENAELLDRQNNLGDTTPLVSENANSLTYYQRGAWAIVALENLVGASTFKKIVRAFLNEFKTQNVTTTNFLAITLKYTNKDVSDWSEKWLFHKKFPTHEALKLLTKSNFMRQYLQLAGERTQPLIGKYQYLSNALNFPINPYLASEAVTQLQEENSLQAYVLLDKAFKSNNPLVLKTIAETFNNIPSEYEPNFRELLSSNSYITVEAALYQLWNNFEENKKNYLTLTESRIDGNNKKIRTAWLALALNTPGFSNQERARFREEFNQYTFPNHPIGLRKFAFNFLTFSNNYTDQSLVNLAEAATHPNWRFNKYCTDTIKNLLEDEGYRRRFRNLADKLSNKVQQLLTTK